MAPYAGPFSAAISIYNVRFGKAAELQNLSDVAIVIGWDLYDLAIADLAEFIEKSCSPYVTSHRIQLGDVFQRRIIYVLRYPSQQRAAVRIE